MVVYTSRFSPISADQEKVLKDDPKFKEHFKEVRTVTLKNPDNKTIEEVIKAVGGVSKFQEMFEAKRSFVPVNPTVQFHVADKIRRLIRQAKPSVKLKKGK